MTDPDRDPRGAAEPRLTVLFVDDDEVVLRTVSRILAAGNFEVLTAAGAGAALKVLDERPVDVLVSDVDMPGLSGLGLMRLVRRDHPGVFRMLLTGNATLEKALNAINEGEVMRFFTKPFDAPHLRAAMEDVFERVRRRRRDEEVGAGRARREELYAWLEEHYPGITELERNSAGEVVVQTAALLAALDADGTPAVRALVARLG